MATARRRIRAVVFDMDGTLTQQGAIDFKRMRERIGAPHGIDILEHVASSPNSAALEEIVREEEELGMQRLKLMPDCDRAFEYLLSRGMHRALLTRNNDDAMRRTVELLQSELTKAKAETAMDKLGSAQQQIFHHMLSRSFTPAKPHPAPLLHLCGQWGIAPHECIMVGDSMDDIACANAAGAIAVLIGADESCAIFQQALPHADHVIRSLSELETVIEELERELR